MSFSRPARCLFSASRAVARPALTFRSRPFHSSRNLLRDQPKPPTVKGNSKRSRAPAAAIGAASSAEKGPNGDVNVEELLPTYTTKEMEQLKDIYTPEQIAAIEAGEKAVDPHDLYEQGVVRDDHHAVKYVDDLAKIDPVVDIQPASEPHYDPKLRLKTDEESEIDFMEWMARLPEEPDPVELDRFLDETRMTVGKEEAELQPRSYVAPELPEITDPDTQEQARLMRRREGGPSGRDDMTPHYERVAKQTGIPVKMMRGLRVKQLVRRRVVNQTRLGKIPKQYVLSVAGNNNGLLGIGEGKSTDMATASRTSVLNAIRNLTPIPRYEERTIYGDVRGKVGGTELMLYTRPPGFGIRCQAKIYEMCKCAGISDLAARVGRSRNPMNTVKAAFQALTTQRIPEEVARARGKKLIDVRKVYYAGNV